MAASLFLFIDVIVRQPSKGDNCVMGKQWQYVVWITFTTQDTNEWGSGLLGIENTANEGSVILGAAVLLLVVV